MKKILKCLLVSLSFGLYALALIIEVLLLIAIVSTAIIELSHPAGCDWVQFWICTIFCLGVIPAFIFSAAPMYKWFVRVWHE